MLKIIYIYIYIYIYMCVCVCVCVRLSRGVNFNVRSNTFILFWLTSVSVESCQLSFRMLFWFCPFYSYICICMNLYTYKWFFFRLSIASVDGKQLLSDFLAKNQTLVIRQSPFSPKISRFLQNKVWIKCAAPVVPSFSFQWKSDESFKHYLTQMLQHQHNYWQAGKKFKNAYEGWRLKVVPCKHL